MPVRLWDNDGEQLSSSVVTEWDSLVTDEEHRGTAEALDKTLDGVLDAALERSEFESTERSAVPGPFIRAWAVGRALNDSDVYRAPALREEPRQLLWRGLARKIRVGVRSDGTPEDAWRALRPVRAKEPIREGGKRGKPDHFEMCKWLAELDIDECLELFGGSIRNVWQMFERGALRSLKIRRALLAWLTALPEGRRRELTEPKVFPEIMKVLRKRWPARGAGSAKRPEHYEPEDLQQEVDRLLAGFVEAPEGLDV